MEENKPKKEEDSPDKGVASSKEEENSPEKGVVSSKKEETISKEEDKGSKNEAQKLYRIHIGRTLRKLLRHKNMTTAELGKMIGYNNSAVSKMLRKPYLHSKVMLDISNALQHDLFQYLYQPGELPANKQLMQENEQLKKEMQALLKEIKYLKKINSLMEKGE